MITKEQFQKALKVIADYAQQFYEINEKVNKPTRVGCTVRLSEYGIEMQGKKKAKLRGIVIEYLPWHQINNDGLSTVKWTGIAEPDVMHVSHLIYCKQNSENTAQECDATMLNK